MLVTRPTNQAPGNKASKPKRKFPYRKVEAIEADIEVAERELGELQNQMLLPEVLRDGRKVKEIQSMIEGKNNDLTQLYAHFEEAMELN